MFGTDQNGIQSEAELFLLLVFSSSFFLISPIKVNIYMISHPIWRIILAGFLLKRVGWDGSRNLADFLPVSLLVLSHQNTVLPARKAKCIMATPAQGQWWWNAHQREPAGLGCYSSVCFVLSGMCGFSKWKQWRFPVPGWSPRPSLWWLFSKVEWLHWVSLHYVQGEVERLAGGTNRCLSCGPSSSRFWVFTSGAVMEFYFLSVWKLGQKSQ